MLITRREMRQTGRQRDTLLGWLWWAKRQTETRQISRSADSQELQRGQRQRLGEVMTITYEAERERD